MELRDSRFAKESSNSSDSGFNSREEVDAQDFDCFDQQEAFMMDEGANYTSHNDHANK